jgi:hypothetical protein
MKRQVRALPVVILVAAAFAPGCFKLKQATTVMPDGSGKMVFTIGFNEKQIKDAMKGMPGGGGAAATKNDPTDVDWAGLDDIMEGIVAFTEPEHWKTEDGWKYVKYTAYFEDLNKVKLYHKGEEGAAKKERLSFTFKKEKKGGYYLECKDTINPDPKKTARAESIPPEAEAFVMPMMEEMFKGLEMERAFMLPGDITKSEATTGTKGRVATSKIESAGIKSMNDFKKLGENKVFKVWAGKSKVTDIEAAAFRAELDEAIEKWEEMKKKAAAKKKAEDAKKAAAEKAGKEAEAEAEKK